MMRAPVVATCAACGLPDRLCCQADGKCAACALHDSCSETPGQSVHGNPDGQGDGLEGES
jgi:hypothetical protein